MPVWSDLIYRWRAIFRRRRVETELDDELRFHFQHQVEKNIERGMAPEEARRQAVVHFGGVGQVKEECRQARGVFLVESLFQDMKYGARTLGKNPGFAATAILTLSLGIGATTAIFSVVNGILLEPLPYRDADRLMVIHSRDERRGADIQYGLSYLDYQEWRDIQNSFSDLALFRRSLPYKLGGRDRTFINVRMISFNLLPILGFDPVIGRGFTPGDDRADAAPTVLLSYSGWQRLFGPRQGILSATVGNSMLGEELQFGGRTYSVIGVLPRNFRFYTSDQNQAPDAYIPIELAREGWTSERGHRGGIDAIGLRARGIAEESARAEVAQIGRQMAEAYPFENDGFGLAASPLFDVVIEEDVRRTLYLFTVAVALVLLVACANVANLMLARGMTRQKEIAIRSAIGGGGWRVARQVVTESVILALAGGAAGLVVAVAAVDLLVLTAPGSLPRIAEVGIDWRVLFFSTGISVLTGLAFGLAPAAQAPRTNTRDELVEGGIGAATGRFASQNALIVTEVAAALVLLLAAGLVLRSTRNALDVEPGFDPEGVWIFRTIAAPEEYPSVVETRSFYERLTAELRAKPEVQAVSIGLGGMPKPAAVDPEYLDLMGIELLRGRFFDERDGPGSTPVIVLDDVLARSRFGDRDPIGQTFVPGVQGWRSIGLEQPYEVIGVVDRIYVFGIQTDDLRAQLETQFGFYLSAEQTRDNLFDAFPPGMLIRTTWNEDEIQNELDRVVHGINPNADAVGAVQMEDALESVKAPRRYAAKLLNLFAMITLLLAGVGIFGLMNYEVSRRRREIGVRMALGAETRHIVREVIRPAGSLAAIGIGAGLVGSLWLTRFIGHLLFEVDALDPVTYAGAVLLLLGAALAAASVPALRASRLQPTIALQGWGGMRSSDGTVHRSKAVSDAGGSQPSALGLHSTAAIATPAPRRRPATGKGHETPSIEVANLRKTYKTVRGRKTEALAGISLEVGPGTIFGLIGQNGAGKSTLVKILMGLTKQTSGTTRLLGCAAGDPIANRRIGYLPENMKIPSHFVADDFMRYMGRLSGVDAATLRTRIPELLERVGLGGIRKPVKTFSKGMQQRLGLAQALVNDPELLFLDEPTDGLDPFGRILVRDLLIDLAGQGRTIFLNSHLLSEVELVCDSIAILEKGVVVRMTTPEEFTRGTGEYLMRVADPDETLARRVLEIAGDVVESAAWADEGLRFRPRDTDQLNAFVDALRRSRVPIVSLEPVRVSLEQYFIQVVTAGDP